MAKIMKKTLAWILALSLCVSFVLPVTALEEGGDQDGQNVTVTITTEQIINEDDQVIGTRIINTTVTEEENHQEYTQTTKVDTDWSSTESETGTADTTVEGNVTTRVETSVTTTVTGSEDGHDHLHSDKETEIQTYSGNSSGNETTVVTDTTTTTTTTTGVLLSDETETTVTMDGEQQEEDWSDPQQTGQGQWVRDPENDVEGTFEEIEGTREGTPSTQESVDVDTDPLENDDAVLSMTTPTGDSPSTATDTLYISLADALEDDIPYKNGEILDDGSVVRYVIEDGKVVGYTITRTAPVMDTLTDLGNVEAGTPGAPVYDVDVSTIHVQPQGFTICTGEPIYDENGQNIGIRTIEEILDENTGNVIGYRITEEILEEGEVTDGTTTEELPTVVTDPRLPDKPTAPAPVTDEDGFTTVVTVEEVYEEGNLVGYATITRVLDEDGNEISRDTEILRHTIHTHIAELTKDPGTARVIRTTVTEVLGTLTTQKYTITTPGTAETQEIRDVTQDVYQLVETDDGLFFLFEGTLYAVTGTAANRSETDVSTKDKVDMNGFVGKGVPDDDNLRRNGDYLPGGGGYIDDYYTNQTFRNYSENYNPKGDYWAHIGYGLFSDFVVKETNGKAHTTKQFKIGNGEDVMYVYCVELGAGISAGTNYGQNTYHVDDDSKTPWKGASGTVEKLRSVSLNGYWGTEDGIGSLEAVKDLMRRNGLADEAENLTAGMAVAATQVAIWEYGTRNDGLFGGEDYNFISWDDSTGSAPSAKTRNTIIALRDLLISLAEDPSGEGKAQEIGTDSITGAGFVLKEKTETRDAADNDIYNTNVTFTLDVSTSSLNGDLVVKVLVDGKEVGGGRLAGEDDFSLFKWGKIYPNENGVYTIENVQLAENVNVTLNLEGTQHLDDGVYVFQGNNNMQDFVGLSKLERDVDLEVNMHFSVTDPSAQVEHTTNTWSESKTDVEAYTRTDSYQRTRTGTITDQTETVNTKVYGTTTLVTVQTKITQTSREWSDSYLYQLKDVDDDDHGGGGGGKKDEEKEEEKDEEKKEEEKKETRNVEDRANAPKTGDITLGLAFVSLFSAAGLVALNRKRKED